MQCFCVTNNRFGRFVDFHWHTATAASVLLKRLQSRGSLWSGLKMASQRALAALEMQYLHASMALTLDCTVRLVLVQPRPQPPDRASCFLLMQYRTD